MASDTRNLIKAQLTKKGEAHLPSMGIRFGSYLVGIPL